MAKKRSLVEGISASVTGAVRNYFARTAQSSAAELRRGGVPGIERAGMPYGITGASGGFDALGDHLQLDQNLYGRYVDYEDMDQYPEISVALDIYADDSTAPQMDKGDVSIWATSESDQVQKELNEVLERRLKVNEDVWGLVRTVCKYGNAYGELLVSDPGLVGIQYMPVPTVRRVESPDGQLLGFMQDMEGNFNLNLDDFYQLASQQKDVNSPYRGGAARSKYGNTVAFEDWEVVHWRLRGKQLRSVYGSAIIDPARWIWKRLSLLEDALLIYKLERTPSRYAFYVDVGTLDAERGRAFVHRVKNDFTRKKFVNPTTGKLDFRFNPLCLAGDTQVQLLDGSAKTIKQIAEEHERGESHWTWATDLDDEGAIKPAEIVWAGGTRKNAQMVKITLDNGREIRVTPDHKMIRRSGEKVEAQHLLPGDSLMPFRRRIASQDKGELDGYELVYDPKSGKSLYGHRLVAEHAQDVIGKKLEVTHHKDFDNCKVVSVEWLDEREDTYTLTVSPCHTFALDAGIFVCNSGDEDLFIPVRDGKRSTEIDVLQGPDYTETDSLEYHRDKLVSSLKIPKAYFGYGGEATRDALSSADIRFARTIMRIQQVTRAGYKHAMYVHQVARGMDPNAHDFDIKMSVPSQIMELARVEVLNATADLASRMGEMVSTRWVLTKLFKFSEDEAAEVMKEKSNETVEKGKMDAAIAKMAEDSESGKSNLSDEKDLDVRLSALMRAERKDDWEREFDANRQADARLETKLEELLKRDDKMRRDLSKIGGLVMDVRKSIRHT